MFMVITIAIIIIKRVPILGFHPTVKLGSDTTLLAPHFESPKCIRTCVRITHKYAQITRIVHRYIIKGSELY